MKVDLVYRYAGVVAAVYLKKFRQIRSPTAPAALAAAAELRRQDSRADRHRAHRCTRQWRLTEGLMTFKSNPITEKSHMSRPATVASGYRGAAGTALTFDCNSHCINQKHA
jgi:hypothetical protein